MSSFPLFPLLPLAAIGLLLTPMISCNRYWVCDEPDTSRTSQLPQRLSKTGLFSDISSGTIADGVSAYRPQFQLWSDGAEKRRWIALPPCTTIDTSDMDDWEFPSGTKVWKEFGIAGKRIETRLLIKQGPGDDDWVGLS